MKKQRFFTQFSPKEYKGEINDKMSLTQPDMLMSLQDMLDRHVRGLPVPSFEDKAVYTDHYEPDPRQLDLVDIAERAETYRQRASSLKAESEAAGSQAANERRPLESSADRVEPPAGGTTDPLDRQADAK